jgi:hypothetical protein
MAWEKQQPPTYGFENISHWLSAFHIFVSIYSEKYPKETGSLMKYADIIQNLARRSCDVAAYIYMIVLIENGANMIMKVYLGTRSILN